MEPPHFVIGINPTGDEDPSRFTPLADGDDLEIEFGFQGLWMVVLAFQSQNAIDGRFNLFARVRTADETLGEFGIAKQILIDADDGYAYYLNLFLVVVGPEPVGEEAWVEIEAEGADGQTVSSEVRVMLTGGERVTADVTGAPSDAAHQDDTSSGPTDTPADSSPPQRAD